MSTLLRLICCVALVVLAACSRLEPPETSGTLIVAIRETPAFFEEEGATAKGFDHDLATAFADSLGFKTTFVMAADPYDLIDLALAGRVHMAASMPLSNAQLEWSAPIRSVSQWIVGLGDSVELKQLSELAGRDVEVLAGSPVADTLRGLDYDYRPRVIEVPGVSEMDLLERVAGRKAALVAVNQMHLDVGVNFYPDLNPMLQLPGTLEFGWAFGGEGAVELSAKANAFIAGARADGTLARLHDRYFGHIKRINSNGIAVFLRDVRTKLPLWRRHFQSAQDLTGIDWRLLAALSYQESHWDPLATSFTGVRGMMMLTEDTADLLRVKNRLDPEESIRAGARYLADLVEQIPASAKYPDRLWLALSAYNLGMGHFRGARFIATTMKRNPDDWYDMKAVLPRLSRPEVYARLKGGAARGGEAVIMVENIRSYYDILSRFEAAHQTPFQARRNSAGADPLQATHIGP
ncbi:MAG: membrane-bound lytic murein transglycosylase MltF [Polynucleobacter sp.]|nr:membrane-bound lytic murein transglycosylase MltF [Polynucleobacter sp.]